MTKKHFIELADHIREHVQPRLSAADFDLVVRQLSYFCATQNAGFKSERWISYVYGRCGPNGGAVKVEDCKLCGQHLPAFGGCDCTRIGASR